MVDIHFVMTHWHLNHNIRYNYKNNTSDYQNRLREEIKEDYDGKFFDHHCTGRKHEKLYGRSDRQKYVEQVLQHLITKKYNY